MTECHPGLSRNVDDRARELVDRHDLLGTEIQRLPVVGPHQSVDPLDAVGHVTERPRLLAVAPDLDGAALCHGRHFSAQRRWHLLPATVVRAIRTVDVMEAGDAGLQAELTREVQAQPLSHELLPPVSVLRIGRVRILFNQRNVTRLGLQMPGVDARRRAVETAAHAVDASRLQRVDVDERVVTQDRAVILGDEPHAPPCLRPARTPRRSRASPEGTRQVAGGRSARTRPHPPR